MIHKNANQIRWRKLFKGKDTESIRQLDSTGQPVHIIYTKGDISALMNPSTLRVAIVGTREMSPYGKQMVEKIIDALSCRTEKPVIISGLALGIETTAHRTALEYKLPTVAVLPTHVDEIYPLQNKKLAEEICKAEASCLISQFPCKTPAMAINFLERNKTIALLSDVVIVVESKERGGAVMTAKYAYDFGIPVLSVPGRVDDIRSKGCNNLIAQQIATMITNTSPETFIETIDKTINRRQGNV